MYHVIEVKSNKTKLFSIKGFFLNLQSQKQLYNNKNIPVYLATIVTKGPTGLMKSPGKQKLFSILSLLIFKFPALKSLLVGGVVVVVVACLIIVSTPGPGFVRVKARFGQVGDEVSRGFDWSSW